MVCGFWRNNFISRISRFWSLAYYRCLYTKITCHDALISTIVYVYRNTKVLCVNLWTCLQYVWLFRNIFRFSLVAVNNLNVYFRAIHAMDYTWQTIRRWVRAPLLRLDIKMYSRLSSSYIMLDFFMSQWPLSRGFVFFCPLLVRWSSLWSGRLWI